MILRKVHFPFFLIVIFITIFLSCNEKTIEPFGHTERIKKADDFFAEIKYDSAFYFYNLAQLKCKEIESDKIFYPLLQMSNIQLKISDFYGSEETSTYALNLMTDKTEISYKTFVYNMLGLTYLEQKNYEEAIVNYYKSLKITNDTLSKCIIKNNIAYSYLEQKNYSKAIETLRPLIKINTLKHNREEYARIIDNLGFAYFNIGEKNKAYHYISKSLRIKDSIGDEYQKLAPLMHLSRFFKDSIISESNRFAINAYDIATKVNSPDDRLEALDILIRNTSDKEEFKNYYEKFSFLRDSIDVVRQTAKNQFAKMKYDTSIEIEKNEKLTAQNNLITFLFLGFGIIVILIYFLIRSKNKREKLKIAYNTEIRISKKLHDELANDVFNTMTFIETQDLENETNKESVLQGLDAIYDKARNISKQTSEVKTGKEFGVVLNQLLMSYNSKQVTVIVKGSALVDWEKIKEDKQVAIHRTLSELLVNMKKYSQANLVLVTFETLEKTIKIQYKDDGIGFEKEKIIKNGLLNVENRIHEINGSITFDTETNKGLKINIEFPK